jgi:hypothetical protein
MLRPPFPPPGRQPPLLALHDGQLADRTSAVVLLLLVGALALLSDHATAAGGGGRGETPVGLRARPCPSVGSVRDLQTAGSAGRPVCGVPACMVPAHSVSGGERYVWVPTLLSGAQQRKAKRCLCLRSDPQSRHPNLHPPGSPTCICLVHTAVHVCRCLPGAIYAPVFPKFY